ncbi:hypothetical protein BX257_4117 [Streptomyces sp. 3212.3]|nr:hypothetical protein ADL25_27870 [Streptomyces sp. NRRL F-5122]REE61533.1 hypothetical protein BX257_4117 [Streptomyces sp. 3212.3]
MTLAACRILWVTTGSTGPQIDGSEKALSIVAAHLAKIEGAVDRTRASHAGQPFTVVHQALVEALQDEGAQRVVPQVVEELARQIPGAAAGP